MRRILAGVLVAVATTFALAAGAGADSHEDGEPTLAAEAELELPAWDQEKVTELAEKLASSVRNLRRSARKQPPDTIASGQSASRMRFMDRLRLIERETRSLHDELSNGEGKDSTFPIFRRIDEVRRVVAADARRMFLPQETIDQIQAARAVLEELRSYYGQPPDTRPALHGPRSSE